MNKPLNSAALMQALACLRLDKWGREGSVLAYMASTAAAAGAEPGQDIQFSARDVRDATGIALRGLTGKDGALTRMLAARVLDLVAGAAGNQPATYRVNSDVGGWAAPWRRLDAPDRVADANDEPVIPTLRAPRGARKAVFVIPPGGRAEPRFVIPPGGRASVDLLYPQGGAQIPSCAAPGGRANGAAVIPPGGRANPAAAAVPLYVVSSSSKEELPEGELPNYSGREEEERFGQIKAAIDARRMGMVIDPSSCAENIRRAVAAGLSLADALVVIGQAHREWGPPVVARQLLAVAQGETITVAMPSAPAPPPETRPHYADIDEIRAVDKRASESGPLIGPERLREFRSAQCAPVACQNGHEEG